MRGQENRTSDGNPDLPTGSTYMTTDAPPTSMALSSTCIYGLVPDSLFWSCVVVAFDEAGLDESPNTRREFLRFPRTVVVDFIAVA